MIIKSKYKIARKVGAPIFEKTQTAKYAARAERRAKSKGRGPRQKSDFGVQMLEKQKARYTYLLTERQFSNYVKKATATKGNTTGLLYSLLERRLDNVIYRLAMASTRGGARQLASHGHVTVNGRRVDIPSYQVREGDVIGIREGSKTKAVFANLDESFKERSAPSWLRRDDAKRTATVVGMPHAEKAEMMFDLNSVIEFYSR